MYMRDINRVECCSVSACSKQFGSKNGSSCIFALAALRPIEKRMGEARNGNALQRHNRGDLCLLALARSDYDLRCEKTAPAAPSMHAIRRPNTM